ncbi:MAG: AI-2E family transporter [Eubacterium sp.]|nr:AI-2E family transporter [Eubacterium sp.]
MKDKREKIRDILKGFLANGGYVVTLVFICTFIVVALINLDTTIGVVEKFCQVMMPFILAFFFAYLIKPISDGIRMLLNKIKKDKGLKLKKVIGITFAYIIVIGALTILVVYIFPQLKDSAKEISSSVKNGYNYLTKHEDEINASVPFMDVAAIIEYVKNNLLDKLMNNSGNIMPYVYKFSSSIFSTLYNILMGLVISIYIVIDGHRLKQSFKRIIYAFAPKKKAKNICEVLGHCNHIFNGFLFGKALDSLIIGILCFIAMSILQLPYALLMSLIVGVTNMIPYFGPIIGAIPGAFIYLFIDPKLTLIFAIMILILQQFDGLYLGPKILGDSTGVKPLWVIFAIIVGGAYFGAIGMFLGVPTVAVFMYLIELFVKKRFKERNIKEEDIQ